MRERTAAMEALGGDRVSGEYLKFTLWKRMKALEDDPTIPLFFGRLDYGEHAARSRTPGERFYIGRRHVTDEARRTPGRRLAGPDLPPVLPGQQGRRRWACGCVGGSASSTDG